MTHIISLYLVQCKYVKRRFKILPPPIDRKILCRKILCVSVEEPMYAIINMVYAMSDMTNMHKFLDIWRILTGVKSHTDKETN